MRRMSAAVIAVIGFTLGCAGGSSAPPAYDSAGAIAIAQLGRQIWSLDQAAAKATEVALPAGLEQLPVEGWIVVPSGAGLLVRFIGDCPEEACAYLDVQVSGSDTPPVAERAEPPRPLSGEEAAMWRARQSAAEAEFEPCTRYYNTVVVPREGDDPWRVYLLATTVEPDEVVLTGHYRVIVSPDGRTLLSTEPLARACIVKQRSGSPTQVGEAVTDGLNAEPIETHVFTSLNYGLTLFVMTDKGIFKVEGSTIGRIER